MIKPWQWTESASERTSSGGSIWRLRDGRGRDRCTIWERRGGGFTWHTWDDNGIGGENDTDSTLAIAKDSAIAAIVRQGWAPGGWEVRW